jgi:hypothetical protein
MRPSPDVSPVSFSDSPAFKLLARSRRYAEELGVDAWAFAVELQSLQSVGLATSDLRWLVSKGCLDHARECSQPEKDERQFVAAGKLVFTARSCFTLTDRGVCAAESRPHDPGKCPARKNEHNGRVPRWDGTLKELWLGRTLIKQFKVPARSQELLLAAFEEEGWPPHIDDPLPPVAKSDPKKRLHDAIRRLNGNQRRLLFSGAGDGRGVRWRLLT